MVTLANAPTRRKRKRADPSVTFRIRTLDAGKRVHRADISRQAEDDTLFGVEETVAKGTILSPPFDPASLNRIVEESSCLPQAIDAMVANLAGYGFAVVPIEEGVEMDPAEVLRLKEIVGWANTEESLGSVHRKYVHDYEEYGYGFYEVIRNRAGNLTLVRQAKASRMRLVRKRDDPITVEVPMRRNGRTVIVKERRRFRRYVQLIRNSTSQRGQRAMVFFKEFGDPRPMNWKTGRYQGEDGQGRVRQADLATEIIHGRQISEDHYGQPRWIGQLPGLLGSREAEVVNLRYFEDNTVPPMMLLVSGGRLTRGSFEELQRILNEQGIGRERQNQIMLIEAVPETSGLDDKGSVTLTLEKLAGERQSDALFKEYQDGNCEAVNSSFRLPPIILGKSQDATFATANVSFWVAETQVFIPERRKHDELLNKTIVNHPAGLGLQTVKLESLGPIIVNPNDIIKALTAGNQMGAMTPRRAVKELNDALGIALDQYPEEGEEGWQDWMDKPLQLGLREIQQTQRPGQQTREEQNASPSEPPVREETTENQTENSRPPRG